jgi:dihydrofolate synthase/folylpolyglutamate synthase
MEQNNALARLGKLHPKIIDLSLERLDGLLKTLNNPEHKLPPTIHVAGTNGKGSTIAMLRAINNAAGRSTHIYTSPHLVRFTERFVVANKEIEQNILDEILLECEIANAGKSITLFEIITAAGFLAFSRYKADLLFLEVGLGGRFDATNVVASPVLSIITPISLDHQQYLGDTLNKIAYEKSGILKPNIPAIIGPQHPDALAVIELKARETNSPLSIYRRDWNITETKNGMKFEIGSSIKYMEKPSLKGSHQVQNAGIALAAVNYLNENLPISNAEMQQGLKNIYWPARLQKLTTGPLIDPLPSQVELWLDGGHNQSATLAIARTLIDWKANDPLITVHLIFGSLNNRDAIDLLTPFINIIQLIRTVSIPGQLNTADPNAIANIAISLGLNAAAAPDINTAVTDIVTFTTGKRIIIVCGSLYLAGSILTDHS